MGQHFLKNVRAQDRIVNSLSIGSDDIIIEIGSGHGELTRRILEKQPKKLLAIEKDSKLITYNLEPIARGVDNLEIIKGDALKLIPIIPKIHNLMPGTYKIIGNIPYYITGRLLRELGELEIKPQLIILTTQKEVADRIVAGPPKMNLLAASVQFWSKPEIIRYISKKHFKPAPKVDSAVLKIKPYPPVKSKMDKENKAQPNTKESKRYYRFVRVLFSQPRKTITNNISAGFGIPKNEVEKTLELLDFKPTLRPQNLNISAIQTLSHYFPKKDVYFMR